MTQIAVVKIDISKSMTREQIRSMVELASPFVKIDNRFYDVRDIVPMNATADCILQEMQKTKPRPSFRKIVWKIFSKTN